MKTADFIRGTELHHEVSLPVSAFRCEVALPVASVCRDTDKKSLDTLFYNMGTVQSMDSGLDWTVDQNLDSAK